VDLGERGRDRTYRWQRSLGVKQDEDDEIGGGVGDDGADLIPTGEGVFQCLLARYLITQYLIFKGVETNICKELQWPLQWKYVTKS
jgi:hypothetical protein